MQNEVGALGLTKPHPPDALRPFDEKAILPIGIEKNALLVRNQGGTYKLKKLIFVHSRQLPQALIGARESQREPGQLAPARSWTSAGASC